MKHLGRKSILKKTLEVGASTAVSRLLGLIREILFARYLGANFASDAFLTAFRIPNFLRKVFAEGALSGALVPAFLHMGKKEPAHLNSLISYVFVFFEIMVFLICCAIFLGAPQFVHFIAPGFSAETLSFAVPLTRILIFFIIFISSSAVLASALQATHHFGVPAWGQVLFNIVFIITLALCNQYELPVFYLAYGLLIGAFVHFIFHLYAFWRVGFRFGAFTQEAAHEFKPLLLKIIPTLIVIGIFEINTWIDAWFASYIEGSITVLHYGASFMRIPLGVFGVAFSTILLPHFARVRLYAPKRLSFYLHEAAKLILFVTVPATLFLTFFSYKIFTTLLLSAKFTLDDALSAQFVLICFLVGLFFFSFNKILLNIFYAHQNLRTPTYISILSTALNIILNWAFVASMGASGLALATSISGLMQTVLYLIFLNYYYNLKIYVPRLISFSMHLSIAMATLGFLFYVLYRCLESMIMLYSGSWAIFMLDGYGYWLWASPLVGVIALIFLMLRKKFGLTLYFLD